MKEVVYSEKHWKILWRLRREAEEVLRALERYNVGGLVVGSVARGDVHYGSDVDVFVEPGTRYFIVENALLEGGFTIMEVRVVRATPLSGLQVVYSLGARVNVVLRLEIRGVEEEEFTRYAGAVDLGDLEEGRRVAGINKKLIFVEPTPKGHREWSILGREKEAAERLGVSLITVMKREEYRLRRYRGGRRGLFIDIKVPYGQHAALVTQLLG